MRKSINVETVTSALVNKERARMWGTKVAELVQNYVASTTFKADWCKQLKEEIEFANANLELLSEKDYNWLLEQQKSPTIEPKKSKRSLSIGSPEFKEALTSAPFVCKTHCDSEEDTTSKPKLTIAATESQMKLWVIQITKGKKVWYKTSGSFKGGYISPSINDAALYYTKADAAYFAMFITPGNTRVYDLPFPVKVTLKEVVYTENGSRTVELVNSPVEASEKPITKTQVRAKKPKVKEEWVLYINGVNDVLWYYNGEINIPTYHSTNNLEDAKKFPSYSAATKARCKLIKAGFITLDVANVEDCK